MTEYNEFMPGVAYQVLEEGKTLRHVAVVLDIHHSTLADWVDEESPRYKGKRLSDAIKKGLQASENYWSDIGMAGALGQIKNFNVIAWIFNMKNRFNWQDKKEIAVKTTHIFQALSDEQLEFKARKLLGTLAPNEIKLSEADYAEITELGGKSNDNNGIEG